MATLGGILGTIGEGAKTLANNPNFNAAVVYSRTGDPAQAARVKLMIQEDARRAEEEKRMQEYYAPQRQLAEMQAMQAYQDMQRQQYSQALLGAASTQPQGLLTDPNFQRSLRQRAAAYGDPKVLEAGGLLAPLPEASKETTLIANLRAAGIDPSSPQGRAIITQSLVKPQTQINMGPDLGQGMMPVDPRNPAAGVTLVPGYVEALAAAEAARAGGSAGPKQAADEAKRNEARAGLSSLVDTMASYYEKLKAGGGIPSTAQGAGENIAATAKSSGMGQAIGGAIGTENQSVRQSLIMSRPLLIQFIKNATGMTARQMDTDRDLQMLLVMATDPQYGYESNMRALQQMDRMYGAGKLGVNSELDALRKKYGQ